MKIALLAMHDAQDLDIGARNHLKNRALNGPLFAPSLG
jgi:hypothetical protein